MEGNIGNYASLMSSVFLFLHTHRQPLNSTYCLIPTKSKSKSKSKSLARISVSKLDQLLQRGKHLGMMKIEIVSRETIKPSSPTPSHLHTYNLSEMDHIIAKVSIPLVLFYSNNNGLTREQKAIILKKSLSQSLTRYYPFAGRLPTPASPYVDCNDDGVLFLEARTDSQLDTIQRSQDEILDQLIVDDMMWYYTTTSANLVAVQLTHFACGGVALAVSLAHAIGDASTLCSFLSHWASVARYGSIDHEDVLPLHPHFFQSPLSQRKDGVLTERKLSHDVKKFMFPNSKLSELKNKVTTVNNPTRVEVLISLLYKTVVASETSKFGCFKPSFMYLLANIRDKLIPKLPQSTVGNLLGSITVETKNDNEISVSMLTEKIRDKKLLLHEENQNLQELNERARAFQPESINKILENDAVNMYVCTSLCGFPFNKLDFGWGKPMGTTRAIKGSNRIVLMDTVDGDGIEVTMCLEKECMEIFENDKEMLSYCDI